MVSVLVVIAAVQAVELGVLKSKIESGSFRASGSASTSVNAPAGGPSGGAVGSGAPSLDSLSGMVGGC